MGGKLGKGKEGGREEDKNVVDINQLVIAKLL